MLLFTFHGGKGMYKLVLFTKWFTSSILIPRYMYQFLSWYTSLFKKFWLLLSKNYRCLPAYINKNMGMYWINSILQLNFSFPAITFLVKNYFKSIFLQKRFPLLHLAFKSIFSIFSQKCFPLSLHVSQFNGCNYLYFLSNVL